MAGSDSLLLVLLTLLPHRAGKHEMCKVPSNWRKERRNGGREERTEGEEGGERKGKREGRREGQSLKMPCALPWVSAESQNLTVPSLLRLPMLCSSVQRGPCALSPFFVHHCVNLFISTGNRDLTGDHGGHQGIVDSHCRGHHTHSHWSSHHCGTALLLSIISVNPLSSWLLIHSSSLILHWSPPFLGNSFL